MGGLFVRGNGSSIGILTNGSYATNPTGDTVAVSVNSTTSAVTFPVANQKISGSSTSTGSFGHGFFDSRLGIGTTSPEKQLHVESAGSDPKALFESTNANTQILIKALNTKNSQIMFGDSDNEEIGMIDYDHDDNSLDFYVNGGTAVTINSSQQTTFNGNVRLGDSIALDLGSGIDSQLFNDGSDLKFRNNTSDQDMIFLVNDGCSSNT